MFCSHVVFLLKSQRTWDYISRVIETLLIMNIINSASCTGKKAASLLTLTINIIHITEVLHVCHQNRGLHN